MTEISWSKCHAEFKKLTVSERKMLALSNDSQVFWTKFSGVKFKKTDPLIEAAAKSLAKKLPAHLYLASVILFTSQ